MGPLALIAKQAGFEISGSDKQDSQYIDYLKKHGINDIHIGQSEVGISKTHASHPIDWYVYTSALPRENPNHPELKFVENNSIKHSKRDELLNEILKAKQLKLIAVAGTHGKTTTTAMVIWLFKQLEMPVSYSVGAKISFGDMGQYDPKSKYFIYECDEFDRNFLAFEPFVSLITGITWDHHEIYPTRLEYQAAFSEFISQSRRTILWQEDFDYLGLQPTANLSILDSATVIKGPRPIKLPGLYNRLDAWLATQVVHELTEKPVDELIGIINDFPGTSRRMEKIVPNLYSDYAHTPEKIIGAMSVALEVAASKRQNVVVVYEPLTNRRMHYMASQHQNVFDGAAKIYWVPSYLAREDPKQPVLTPLELIKNLSPGLQSIASPMTLDKQLEQVIREHLSRGDMVICMSGGGGGSLDEWLRENFGDK